MNSDTPLIEYLIIGTHTTLCLLILIAKLFGIPLSTFLSIDPAAIVIALPFIYLIGMLFDDLAFRPLDPIRMKIRAKIFDADIYKDEVIAYASEQLYNAYEGRVRRVRVLGASVFNWPLLGLAILVQLGKSNYIYSTYVFIISILLSWISFVTWKNLYRRAYKFRRSACDVIFQKENLSATIEPKVTKSSMEDDPKKKAAART
jgi:hypothetical protein